MAWLLAGCSEPETISDYIAHSHQQAKAQTQNAPPALLSVSEVFSQPAPPLAYQALAQRSPFLWPQEAGLALQLPPHQASTAFITQVAPSMVAPHQRLLDCEWPPTPDLALRATFSEHQGRRGSASALIQVAGGEVYSVQLGQRLITHLEGPITVKNVANKPATGLGEDLGTVTAITGQTVTLTPTLSPSFSSTATTSSRKDKNADCHPTQPIILSLH